MRLLHSLLVTSLFFVPTFAACGDGGGGEEAFDTFQDCFDDHHLEEDFDIIDSIKICCIDHPIGGQDADIVCGESADACADFVDAELDPASADLPDIETACDEYIVEREQ